MPSNPLLLLLLLPSIFSSIRVFSNESVLRIRWPKYWSFSFNISPSKEYSWLISFRMDWFNLLAVQGTLKSLLQHHSSKASILRCSAFFMVQLSHPYMTTGKTIALSRRTFVGKVMSLFFNIKGLIFYHFSKLIFTTILWRGYHYFPPFFRLDYWGWERLSNMLKVTQLDWVEEPRVHAFIHHTHGSAWGHGSMAFLFFLKDF